MEKADLHEQSEPSGHVQLTWVVGSFEESTLIVHLHTNEIYCTCFNASANVSKTPSHENQVFNLVNMSMWGFPNAARHQEQKKQSVAEHFRYEVPPQCYACGISLQRMFSCFVDIVTQ